MTEGINNAVGMMIKQSGRSWWQGLYRDGRTVSEWDTTIGNVHLPVPMVGRTSRWEEVKKEGLIGFRIVCPNGQIGELESNREYRFFQLKTGFYMVGMGQFCKAHIIGAIEDDGTAKCFAWETVEKRIVQFTDNVFNFQYDQIGRLNLDVQGVRL